MEETRASPESGQGPEGPCVEHGPKCSRLAYFVCRSKSLDCEQYGRFRCGRHAAKHFRRIMANGSDSIAEYYCLGCGRKAGWAYFTLVPSEELLREQLRGLLLNGSVSAEETQEIPRPKGATYPERRRSDMADELYQCLGDEISSCIFATPLPFKDGRGDNRFYVEGGALKCSACHGRAEKIETESLPCLPVGEGGEPEPETLGLSIPISELETEAVVPADKCRYCDGPLSDEVTRVVFSKTSDSFNGATMCFDDARNAGGVYQQKNGTWWDKNGAPVTLFGPAPVDPLTIRSVPFDRKQSEGSELTMEIKLPEDTSGQTLQVLDAEEEAEFSPDEVDICVFVGADASKKVQKLVGLRRAQRILGVPDIGRGQADYLRELANKDLYQPRWRKVLTPIRVLVGAMAVSLVWLAFSTIGLLRENDELKACLSGGTGEFELGVGSVAVGATNTWNMATETRKKVEDRDQKLAALYGVLGYDPANPEKSPPDTSLLGWKKQASGHLEHIGSKTGIGPQGQLNTQGNNLNARLLAEERRKSLTTEQAIVLEQAGPIVEVLNPLLEEGSNKVPLIRLLEREATAKALSYLLDSEQIDTLSVFVKTYPTYRLIAAGAFERELGLQFDPLLDLEARFGRIKKELERLVAAEVATQEGEDIFGEGGAAPSEPGVERPLAVEDDEEDIFD